MAVPRSIGTRLAHAVYKCVLEMSDIPTIYGTPENPGSQIFLGIVDPRHVRGRQMQIIEVPNDYEVGVGGVQETLYTISVSCYFPLNDKLYSPTGTWPLDDLRHLKAWLAKGGNLANKTGALNDPDDATKTIAYALQSVRYQPPRRYGPEGQTIAIAYGMTLTYATREDTQGARA